MSRGVDLVDQDGDIELALLKVRVGMHNAESSAFDVSHRESLRSSATSALLFATPCGQRSQDMILKRTRKRGQFQARGHRQHVFVVSPAASGTSAAFSGPRVPVENQALLFEPQVFLVYVK